MQFSLSKTTFAVMEHAYGDARECLGVGVHVVIKKNEHGRFFWAGPEDAHLHRKLGKVVWSAPIRPYKKSLKKKKYAQWQTWDVVCM